MQSIKQLESSKIIFKVFRIKNSFFFRPVEEPVEISFSHGALAKATFFLLDESVEKTMIDSKKRKPLSIVSRECG
jgi:hypothetical protein